MLKETVVTLMGENVKIEKEIAELKAKIAGNKKAVKSLVKIAVTMGEEINVAELEESFNAVAEISNEMEVK